MYALGSRDHQEFMIILVPAEELEKWLGAVHLPGDSSHRTHLRDLYVLLGILPVEGCVVQPTRRH